MIYYKNPKCLSCWESEMFREESTDPMKGTGNVLFLFGGGYRTVRFITNL